MTYLGKPRMTVTAGALLAGALLTSAAVAQPAISPSASQGFKPTQDSNVQLVRDGRGWGRGGWRGHRGWGRGWGWGLGAAGAGLLLAAPYYGYGYDDGYGYGDGYYAGDYDDGYDADAGGFARCQQTFRSFDPSSGTYMGYDGVRRRCPYI
jgi:hypothetical protein